MEKKFGEFFKDPNYLIIKNSLFNYQNRKTEIKNEFFSYCTNKTKNVKALDIGSGISPVSPIPNKTLFMDLSLDGINFLSNLGLNAKQGSITDIPEKENEFGWIFCSEVLEHVEDYNKAIAELHRVLKYSGKIIITVPVHMGYWNKDDEFVEHYRRFNPDELKKELEYAGFKILKEKPIGSFVDKYLTLLTVLVFKKFNKSNKSMSDFKKEAILFVNKIFYNLVRFSLFFTSKKSTNIMMYVCEK